MKQCNCNKQIGKTGVIVHDEWCNIYHHPMNNPETVEELAKQLYSNATMGMDKEFFIKWAIHKINQINALRDKQLREKIEGLKMDNKPYMKERAHYNDGIDDVLSLLERGE